MIVKVKNGATHVEVRMSVIDIRAMREALDDLDANIGQEFEPRVVLKKAGPGPYGGDFVGLTFVGEEL